MSTNPLFEIRQLHFAYNDEDVLNIERLEILQGKITPRDAIRELMERTLKNE